MRSAEGLVVLKRFLSILNDLIFDSKVDPGRPSLTAAPAAPDTCPPLSRRAASIISEKRRTPAVAEIRRKRPRFVAFSSNLARRS